MQSKKILLVDDDPDLLELLSIRLTAAGYETVPAESAEAAINYLDISRPHLVISDIQMSGMDGMALFEHIHRHIPTLPVIILTAFGTIPDAVAATQRGIFGYLTKPYNPKILLSQVERAIDLAPAVDTISSKVPAPTWRKAIITRSALMEDLLAKVDRVAQGNASVLLSGESGVGKELFARAIHQASKRCEQPFITINCAAIPEQLLESELFGHAKGAFTGAVREHKGLFQLAEGGSLFLDEIGDMPLLLQAKLLHALQERVIRPVGTAQSIPIDVRIISATHKDLKSEIQAGNFREDLYYRLFVVGLTIPSLAQRGEDIPLLANHFLRVFAEKHQKDINGFSPEAISFLLASSWPGNIRQLMNVIEQSIVMSAVPLISSELIRDAMHKDEEQMISFEEARKQFERDYLVKVLKITAGNVTQAARLAKRNRTEFYKLLQRHQLDFTLYKSLQEKV
ncbi:two component, sigma54 specific, transcriptional regulator, Fis family [Nitrosomonas eutropha]|nr:two component Fis family sigma54 specific transcriptional regulator [Nitrosomonas eutropha]SCX23551.1 two component, sigma54 specific, transcriptional regulator, Fis family [Nitrosomonas eutropha]SDW09286.1 two component, sigma54 specific, transcriptional regulator, Fis family [Nitrosomonas eutropha]SEI49609.1 two component, sigma54 specific, transcriptional regulator, Fis family [Nitrosomonas eutropha]